MTFAELLAHAAPPTAALELVKEFCAGHVTEVRTAVVYEKPRSVVSCDYAWKRTDAWINFPWSTLPPVVSRGGSSTR